MSAAFVTAVLLCAAVPAVAESQVTVDANDLVAHISPLKASTVGRSSSPNSVPRTTSSRSTARWASP